MEPSSSFHLMRGRSWNMCSQIFLSVKVCHTIILDVVTVAAMMRVRTIIIAFLMLVASFKERTICLVATAETAEDSSAMLFWTAAIWAPHDCKWSERWTQTLSQGVGDDCVSLPKKVQWDRRKTFFMSLWTCPCITDYEQVQFVLKASQCTSDLPPSRWRPVSPGNVLWSPACGWQTDKEKGRALRRSTWPQWGWWKLQTRSSALTIRQQVFQWGHGRTGGEPRMERA